MKPFFSYYGSKYRLSQNGFYPPPAEGNIVIESFAGSACYSVFHEPEIAILIDSNPKIIGIWNYLIKATAEQIEALPTFNTIAEQRDFKRIMAKLLQAERDLIGFWTAKARPQSSKAFGVWARKYANAKTCRVWGDAVKLRIISQLPKIRGWRATCSDYHNQQFYQFPYFTKMSKTYFIDPPYSGAGGRKYPHNKIDYEHLEHWVKTLKGQVICCENEDLTHRWADFDKTKPSQYASNQTKQELCYLRGFQNKAAVKQYVAISKQRLENIDQDNQS